MADISKNVLLKKCKVLEPNTTNFVDTLDVARYAYFGYEVSFKDLSTEKVKSLKASISIDDQEVCEQVYAIGGTLEGLTFDGVIDNGLFKLKIENNTPNKVRICYARIKL